MQCDAAVFQIDRLRGIVSACDRLQQKALLVDLGDGIIALREIGEHSPLAVHGSGLRQSILCIRYFVGGCHAVCDRDLNVLQRRRGDSFRALYGKDVIPVNKSLFRVGLRSMIVHPHVFGELERACRNIDIVQVELKEAVVLIAVMGFAIVFICLRVAGPPVLADDFLVALKSLRSLGVG